MNNIGKNYFDLVRMETLAEGSSFLHQLDPRAKLITALAFIISVVSFDKYTLSALTPFFLYPAILISIGRLPSAYLWKKALWTSPFAILVGIFNPLIDHSIIMQVGPLGISGGWISFFSIFIRCLLTVTAALILISLTGFNSACRALLKLGVPKYFVVQLLFFYRYVFVLIDEAERMVRARSLRSFRSGAMRWKLFIPLIGNLLLRALDRAERIYLAMRCRGFDGEIRIIKQLKIRKQELIFTAGCIAVFILLRSVNIPLKIGELLTRGQ